MIHPSDEALAADPLDPEVGDHAARCVRCRARRRMVRAAPGPDLPEAPPAPAALLEEIARARKPAASVAPPDDPMATRYDLAGVAWLGEGPRGRSHTVLDREAGRRVVLRHLHAVDADALRRVAATLRALRHPALAPWLDVVPGAPLRATRAWVEGEELPEGSARLGRPRLVRIVGLLASALDALHRAGVAHGGLSPSNVRLPPGGGVRLVDAGLGGLPAGAPERAPELADGQATAAGDWFALGALVARAAPQLLDPGASPPGPVAEVLRRLTSPDPAARPAGREVLAALLLEQGLGDVHATPYDELVLLDEGGMGVLFSARDPMLGRRVALKKMRDRVEARADALQRFAREASVAARLEHPNILPVHARGALPDGSPYFTMKLVDRRDLDLLVREGRARGPGWYPEAAELFLKLCDAVAYAHSRGVVHLDLKPSNVLVGGFGELQLIDWGLAKVLEGSDLGLPPSPGGVDSGTRGWRAPEQRPGGDPAALGRPADVWALGGLLQFLLTGAGPTPGADGDGALPPVREVDPAVPWELAAIVARARSPDPGARYPDAAALGADVRAWIRGDRVAAARYGLLADLERRTRRRRGLWVLGTVAALLLGTVSWFAWLSAAEAARAGERERQRAADALAERAHLALQAGDRIAAERLAARAVVLADHPDGRGVLARLARRPYPVLAPACAPGACAGGPPDRARCGAFAVEDAAGLVVRDAAGAVILARPEATTPAACDPAGRSLAFGVGEDVHVWRLAPLAEDPVLSAPEPLVAVAWGRAGIAGLDGDGLVTVWSPRTGAETARLPGHRGARALAFDPDGATLRVDGDAPRAWALPGAARPDRVEAMVPLDRVWFGADRVATRDRQGTWRTWRPDSGAFAGEEVRAPAGGVREAALAPGGGAVAVVAVDGGLRIAPLTGGAGPTWGPVPGAAAVAWLPDAVVAAEPDGRLRVLDPATGVPRREGEPPADGPLRALVAAGPDAVAVLTDGLRAAPVTGGPPRVLAAAADRLVAIAGSSSGALAAAARDGAVRAGGADRPWAGWDPVAGPGPSVTALALSPDGRTLAVARADHTVRVARLGPGGWREAARAVSGLRGAADLAFSPDGAVLAVAVGVAAELWDTTVFGEPPSELADRVAARYGPDALGDAP